MTVRKIVFLSSHFIANRVNNSNDDFSQLSFDVYYVFVARKLWILEKTRSLDEGASDGGAKVFQ